MSDFRMTDDLEWAAMAKEVRGSSLPEGRKLALAFGWITNRIITHAEKEVEAARALRDEESAINRTIFEECYLPATGRKAWDE